MRLFTLFLLAALAVTSLDAASYQKTDGIIVDPIQYRGGMDHHYSGSDLMYEAYLPNADLSDADLPDANLIHADLTNANLSGVNLKRSLLGGNVMAGTNLSGADMTYTHLCLFKLNRCQPNGY